MKLSEFLEMFGASESAIVNLTGAEAIEAVKQNGLALRYVKEQTPDICLAAVKQNGLALRFVKEQTPDICLEAVKQNGLALRFVDKSIFDQEAPAAQMKRVRYFPESMLS